MWFSKPNNTEVAELRNRIRDLELELVRKDNSLTEANARLRNIEDATTKASVVIDFDTMRVFSIERNISSNRPYTIIGYYMSEPVLSSDGEMIVNRDDVKEWTLYCNEHRHEELVRAFKGWKTK